MTEGEPRPSVSEDLTAAKQHIEEQIAKFRARYLSPEHMTDEDSAKLYALQADLQKIEKALHQGLSDKK